MAKQDKNRAVSISELFNTKFKPCGFTGEWLRSIGDPEIRGSWIIWGHPANGKTSYAVQLAKYFSQFGRVAYNSLEEGASLSIKRIFQREGMEAVKRKVILLDQEPMDEMVVRLGKQKSPDIIVIDSLQYADLNYNAYKQLRNSFPKKLFIFISHAEGKEPAGRVAKKVRYDCFVKIWVEGYVAYPQSRYGGGESYTIWAEGSEKYNLN